ncbi:MAG: CHAT domain-containing protein, partial [Cyanobacteriota bacterium]
FHTDLANILGDMALGDLAEALTNLGDRYSELDRRQEALAPTEEALRIYRELAKTNPAFLPDLAMALNNLGNRYSELGRRQQALAPTEEAFRIHRELAKTNPAFLSDLAGSLNNLGNRYIVLGRRQQALAPTEEAVKIYRELAKTNPAFLGNLATALNNLGILYRELGRRQEAQAPTEEAVKIYRELTKTNPAYLENLARSTTNLANLLIQQGNPRASVPLLLETVSSEVSFLQRQLPLMAEARRQDLVDTLGGRWQLPFSLANQGEAGAALALYTRLNRHGPLQDIERRQGLLARATGAPRQLVDRLTALTAELANPSLPVDKRQQALEESERLQRELFQQLPALQPRLVEIAQVARWLPPDGALVEFQRFSPYDPRQPSGKEWAAPRYLAMVLQASGKVAAVDLGEADPLEQAIANALDHTRRQEPQADRAWALVAETVFTPLQSQLAGLGHVLISPDGQLHRVPFSALAQLAGASRALPAQATLQTIGSGRDLVPVAAKTGQGSSPVVLANPTTTGWPVLAKAASEGQAVAASLGVQANLGPGAKVALLEQARGPRILHVAAHGYFDPQAKGDPLLASGLVLAGADKARQPSQQAAGPPSPSAGAADDGYLTAKEAARLQLEGTELVVLSACETGRGDYLTGEGLFGLQRALSVAGARGTLLSLWKVPEHATETFMTRFYALRRQGIAPAEAVRRVQSEFRSQPRIDGWKDPYYWAGWQYSGPPDHLK